MGRKRTLKTNVMKAPKVYLYEVGILIGEEIERIEVLATRMEFDMESLIAYQSHSGVEMRVAHFNNWVYYLILDDGYARKDESGNRDDKGPDFPEGWGKVK